jgi:hypothetical protein
MGDRVPNLDEMFDYILNRTANGKSRLFAPCRDILGNPFYTNNTRWVLLQQILADEVSYGSAGSYHKFS